MRFMRRESAVIFALFLSLTTINCNCLQYTIKVCQNKHCVKQFPASSGEDLVSVFRNLLPPSEKNHIAIETSGCLSQCGKGPNICVTSIDHSEKEYGGVDHPEMASAILSVACGVDVPPMIIAACDVMGQANKSNDPAQKEKLLSSAITVLESSDFSTSNALTSALIQRADARLYQSPPDIHGALQDSTKATQIQPRNSKAWRLLAEANEAAGNYGDAIEAVKQWAHADSSFSTKAKKEIARLLSMQK